VLIEIVVNSEPKEVIVVVFECGDDFLVLGSFLKFWIVFEVWDSFEGLSAFFKGFQKVFKAISRIDKSDRNLS